MTMTRMPNGEYVDLPDDITPEGRAKVEAQFKATRVSRRAQQPTNERGRPITAEQAEVNRRVKAREDRDISGGFNTFNDKLRHGNFFGIDDEIAGAVSAATRGTYNAIKEGSLSEYGKEYRIARDTEKKVQRRFDERNPVTGAAAEVVGAIANPVGTGEMLVTNAGKLLGKAAIPTRSGARVIGADNALTRLGTRMSQAGPVAKAAMAGGFQGSLNAAGNSEDLAHMPGDAINGALFGMGAGAGLGALGHMGQRGVQILKDRGALGRFSGPGGQDGSRAAYNRVGQMLERGGMSPEQAARKIKLTDARGGDAMVMDMTPGLTSEAGYLSRQTNLPSSNRMIERGQQRWDSRRASAVGQIEGNATLPPGARDFDSIRQAEHIAGTRKATGEADYAPGGAMDNPIKWNSELDDFFKGAPRQTDDAMKAAYDDLALRRDDPNLFKVIDADGKQTYFPQNFRAWDYMKRAFDSKIGAAIKGGDNPTAQGLSLELNRLKGILIKQNPEYEQILAAQRDLFQQQRALEMGQKAWKAIKTNPRKALRDVRDLTGADKDNARIGIIDHFINDVMAKDDAVAAITAVTRNKHQEQLLRLAFGGDKQFGIFKRYAMREVAARNADAATRMAGQSITSRMQQAGAAQGGDLADLGIAGAAGAGFGGVTGAVANIARKVQHMAGGISETAQEKIAQILMSKGDDLVPRIKEVAEYMTARKAMNKRRGVWLGKAAQQPFSTEIGGE